MAPPHPMSTYEARKTSFLQKEAASGPSRKKGAAAISKLSWPHPFTKRSNDRSKGSSSDDGKANKVEDAYPSPRSLANLGLYYDPTTEEDDRCTVYPDGHSISGWRRGQSALERLEEEDPLISWVMIERSKRASEAMTAKDDGKLAWTRQAESMYPTGKVMNDARWRTYGGAWPLDGKKGWKPTSKKLASAGFHFTPNDDEEDCVSCIYCQCSLGGWEKSDDPVKEHQKRKPECAIFVSELEKVEKKQEASSSKAANSCVAKSRTASRKRAAEPDETAEAEASTSTRTRTKSNRSVEAPEVVKMGSKVDDLELKPAAKKRKKATTASAKSVSKKEAIVEMAEDKLETPIEEKEEVQIEEKEEAILEEEREASPPKTTTKKTTKKAPVKKKAGAKKKTINTKSTDMEVDDKEVEASDFEEAPSRSHSRDSGKDVVAAVADRAKSLSASPETETFKTPKQTTSGRPTEKTPKPSSPLVEKKTTKKSKVAAPASTAAPVTTIPTAPIVYKGDIPPLEKLETLTLLERSMTVEEWLKSHVKKACTELEAEGNRRIATLKIEMNRGRVEAERILRGINVN